MQTHYLSCEVFQDSCAVHRCCSTNTTVARGSSLQMSVDTSYRELKQTREMKIRSNMSIKNTVHNFEVNAIKICPTPPSCVNRKYNKRKNKKNRAHTYLQTSSLGSRYCFGFSFTTVLSSLSSCLQRQNYTKITHTQKNLKLTT